MSQENKHAKRILIHKYGKVCFLEELGIRNKEEVQKEIKMYGSKKQRDIMDEITYHHILEKCRGGKATEENGALLRNINHQWFNRLSKQQQAELNKLFQEYKRECSQKMQVEFVDDLEIDYVVKAMQFVSQREKAKHNRAKDKKELREKIKDWENEK